VLFHTVSACQIFAQLAPLEIPNFESFNKSNGLDQFDTATGRAVSGGISTQFPFPPAPADNQRQNMPAAKGEASPPPQDFGVLKS